MTDPVRDYWDQLCLRNPGLTTSTHLRISVDSFRRAVTNAYSQGLADAELESANMNTLEALFGSFNKTPKRDQL